MKYYSYLAIVDAFVREATRYAMEGQGIGLDESELAKYKSLSHTENGFPSEVRKIHFQEGLLAQGEDSKGAVIRLNDSLRGMLLAYMQEMLLDEWGLTTEFRYRSVQFIVDRIAVHLFRTIDNYVNDQRTPINRRSPVLKDFKGMLFLDFVDYYQKFLRDHGYNLSDSAMGGLFGQFVYGRDKILDEFKPKTDPLTGMSIPNSQTYTTGREVVIEKEVGDRIIKFLERYKATNT